MGATVRLISAPVEFTKQKIKRSNPRNILVMVKPRKIQTHIKSQPKELIKKVNSRMDRKDKTILQINVSPVESPICCRGKSPLRTEAIPLAQEWV